MQRIRWYEPRPGMAQDRGSHISALAFETSVEDAIAMQRYEHPTLAPDVLLSDFMAENCAAYVEQSHLSPEQIRLTTNAIAVSLSDLGWYWANSSEQMELVNTICQHFVRLVGGDDANTSPIDNAIVLINALKGVLRNIKPRET